MTALASSRNDRHEAPPNSPCHDIAGSMFQGAKFIPPLIFAELLDALRDRGNATAKA
jgi:hypothetical protein